MLEKIAASLGDVVRTISGKATISEKNIEDAVEKIKVALLEADVNLRVVRRFVNSTIEEAKGEKVIRSVNPGQQFTKIIYDKIVALLGSSRPLTLKSSPAVILMVGVNGAGKTTTATKLALKLTKLKRHPLLVAADLARPAAIEQLRVMAQKAGCPFFSQEEGDKTPEQVAKSSVKYATCHALDTVIIDTAGRQTLDSDLMKELQAIKKAVNPDEVLLTIDSMTGQKACDIAKGFDDECGITGIILSKFDSDARGGAALSLRSILERNIVYIGTGEKIEDLTEFHPERIASRILGMGDVVSLVEKAQETIDKEEALELSNKLSRNAFTLQDMLEQLERVKKMGSLKSVVEMLPGLAGQVKDEDINTAQIKEQEAIILSMTLKERANHLIIGPRRRARIAQGSGTSVAKVAKLIKQFEKTRLTMKKLSRNKALLKRLAMGK